MTFLEKNDSSAKTAAFLSDRETFRKSSFRSALANVALWRGMPTRAEKEPLRPLYMPAGDRSELGGTTSFHSTLWDRVGTYRYDTASYVPLHGRSGASYVPLHV